jgi:hypothetical protein
MEGNCRVAKETITKLIDDFDGGEAHETVKFALDGHSYEIDLSSKNASKLRNALSPYLENATRIPAATGVRTGAGRGAAVLDRDQSQAIRAWAQRKGLDVALRGRIKQEIIDQYNREAAR